MPTIGLVNDHAIDQIPASHADLVECPPVAALTTVMRDGYPQTSVVWCDFDDPVGDARQPRKVILGPAFRTVWPMSSRTAIATIPDMDMYVVAGRTLRCADCGRDFEFTAAEQRFHRAMGFADPLRCAACLTMRRARYRPRKPTPAVEPEEAARQRLRGCARPNPGARETDGDDGHDHGRNRHDGRAGRRAHIAPMMPPRATSGTGE